MIPRTWHKWAYAVAMVVSFVGWMAGAGTVCLLLGALSGLGFRWSHPDIVKQS